MGNGKTCTEERELEAVKPAETFVTEYDLALWEAAVENPQLLEIVRLARIGLAAEKYSIPILDALTLVIGDLEHKLVARYIRAKTALKSELP